MGRRYEGSCVSRTFYATGAKRVCEVSLMLRVAGRRRSMDLLSEDGKMWFDGTGEQGRCPRHVHTRVCASIWCRKSRCEGNIILVSELKICFCIKFCSAGRNKVTQDGGSCSRALSTELGSRAGDHLVTIRNTLMTSEASRRRIIKHNCV